MDAGSATTATPETSSAAASCPVRVIAVERGAGSPASQAAGTAPSMTVDTDM